MTGAPASPRGPLLMMLATLCFTVMVGAVKVARAELSALEVIVWRTAISAPLALSLCRKTGIGVRAWRVLALRVALGTGAMFCFFTAAKGLAMADLSILSRLQPIAVALLAPLTLGAVERSSPRVRFALGAGLAGSALIVGPELRVGNVYGLWALAATLLSAGAHVAVRSLGSTDDPRVVVFWFQVGACTLAFTAHGTLTGSAIALPPLHLWGTLAAVGLFATLGQVAMTFAYKAAPAARVAAASYTAPLFGLAGDLLFFDGWPSPLALLGGLLVTAAGLSLVWRRQNGPSASRETP